MTITRKRKRTRNFALHTVEFHEANGCKYLTEERMYLRQPFAFLLGLITVPQHQWHNKAMSR